MVSARKHGRITYAVAGASVCDSARRSIKQNCESNAIEAKYCPNQADTWAFLCLYPLRLRFALVSVSRRSSALTSSIVSSFFSSSRTQFRKLSISPMYFFLILSLPISSLFRRPQNCRRQLCRPLSRVDSPSPSVVERITSGRNALTRRSFFHGSILRCRYRARHTKASRKSSF